MSRSSHPPLSILQRMLIGGLALTAISLGGIYILLAPEISGSLEGAFQKRMAFEVDALIAALDVDDDGDVTLDFEPANPLFSVPYSGWYWQVSFDGGHLRSRSLWDWPGSLRTVTPHDGGVLHARTDTGPNGQILRIVERDIRLNDDPGVIHVALGADTADLTEETQRLLGALGVALVTLFVLLCVTTAFQATFVTQPLRTFAAQLHALKTGADKRLPERQPRELRPVAAALNAVLDHDADLIGRARTHVGNLAHGLKTPLAVLRTAAENRDAVDADLVRTEVETMRRLVERHLVKARSTAGSAALRGVAVDVAAIADRLRSMMLTLHPGPLDIRIDADPNARFSGDSDDITEILGNLMDNACKWAKTVVRVQFRKRPGVGLELRVEDDGPGLAQAQRHTALQRGARLDDTVSGSGLGLDIVRDLTALYGGRLTMDRSPDLGGLAVIVSFPAR